MLSGLAGELVEKRHEVLREGRHPRTLSPTLSSSSIQEGCAVPCQPRLQKDEHQLAQKDVEGLDSLIPAVAVALRWLCRTVNQIEFYPQPFLLWNLVFLLELLLQK